MESEIINKITELISLCKNAVTEHSKQSEPLRIINSHHARIKNKKISSDQRKRLRKHLQVTLSCTESLQTLFTEALAKLVEIKSMEHQIKISKGPRNLRRGVLMSLLQDSAKSIPLWEGKIGESPPPLCGAMGVSSVNEYAVAGDHLAALIPDLETSASSLESSENWILAEYVSYIEEKNVFQVDDVDAEEGKARYILDNSKLILLAKWKADPIINPEAIFPKGSLVLALYPQTTCFYRAVVDTSPVHPHDDYSLYFEDPTFSDGYAPAIVIPQRYVIKCPENDNNRSVGSDRKRIPSLPKKR